MARKRMIDPNIWQSEDFSKLSTLAKLVFIGLFSNADDAGRGRAKAAYIKSILFPYDEGMRVIDIDKTLSEIASNMSVTFYLHDENEYYSLDKWSKWQKVEKPTPSNLPPFNDNCSISRGTFGEELGNVRGVVAPNRIEQNRTRIEENTYCPAGPDAVPKIISHLNSVCGTNYRPTSKATQKHINARLNEGFSLDDFIVVIDKKHFEWGNDPKMVVFLRPETLFGTKFESYLNQPFTKDLSKGEKAVIDTLNYEFKGDYFDE